MLFPDGHSKYIIEVTTRKKKIETHEIKREDDEELFNVIYGIDYLRHEDDVDGTPLSLPEYEAILDGDIERLRPFLGKFFNVVRKAKSLKDIEEYLSPIRI